MTGTGGTALLFFFCRAAAGQNVVAFAACRGRSVLQHGIWCRSCRGCSHSMAVGHRTCRRKPFVLHQGAAPTIHRFENREKAFTERRQRVIDAGRNDRINCAGNQTVFFQFAVLPLKAGSAAYLLSSVPPAKAGLQSFSPLHYSF